MTAIITVKEFLRELLEKSMWDIKAKVKPRNEDSGINIEALYRYLGLDAATSPSPYWKYLNVSKVVVHGIESALSVLVGILKSVQKELTLMEWEKNRYLFIDSISEGGKLRSEIVRYYVTQEPNPSEDVAELQKKLKDAETKLKAARNKIEEQDLVIKDHEAIFETISDRTNKRKRM